MTRLIPAVSRAVLLATLPGALSLALLVAAAAPAYTQNQQEDKADSPVPQPDAVTHNWAFDFEYTTPDTIAVVQPDGSIQWYWYMTYKVTNYDRDELFFDPKIVIQHNTGKIATANLGIPNRVFNAVRNEVQNPLLLSPLDMPGRVFTGDDYARQSAIIWKAPNADIDSFRVFVGGIYGESKIVTDPATNQPIMIPVIDALTGEPKKDADGMALMQPLLVHRTKLLHYKTPGTVINLQDPSIDLIEEKDVMR